MTPRELIVTNSVTRTRPYCVTDGWPCAQLCVGFVRRVGYGQKGGVSAREPSHPPTRGKTLQVLSANCLALGCAGPYMCGYMIPHACPYMCPCMCPCMCPYVCPYMCPHICVYMCPYVCPYMCPYVCPHSVSVLICDRCAFKAIDIVCGK